MKDSRFRTIFGKKLLAGLLVLALCFSFAGCSAGPVELDGSRISWDSAKQMLEIGLAGSNQTEPGIRSCPVYAKYAGYTEYDDTALNEMLDGLEAALAADDTEAFFKMYAKVGDEINELSRMVVTATILRYENVFDETAAQYWYSANVASINSMNRLMYIFKDALEKPAFAKRVEALIGNNNRLQYIKDLPELTDETEALLAEEQELLNEYYAVSNYSLYEVTYNGENYNFGDIIYLTNGLGKLKAEDPEAYTEIRTLAEREFNQAVGEVYCAIVDVRDRIAKDQDYDNYAVYKDRDYFHGYDSSELDAFKAAVKEYLPVSKLPDIVPLKQTPVSEEDMVNYIRTYAPRISGVLADSAAYFFNNHLYSLGSDSNRSTGGYTIVFNKVVPPFIYYKNLNTVRDYSSVMHELGHFTNQWLTASTSCLEPAVSYDIGEVHSQGLEALNLPFFAEYDPENADAFEFNVVFNMVDVIPSGCIFDDWQRYVYENPGLTLDEMNKAFRDISLSYGTNDTPFLEYTWARVHHNFIVPMYYISYATSAYGALQIYELSKTDYDKAVSVWEHIVADDTDKGFIQTCEDAGLTTITDAEALKAVLTSEYVENVLK